MTGVTIGINPLYKKMASLSSCCLREMTGLDIIILGESEYKKTKLIHPAAMKFKVFDLIDDDEILYFDADWFCIREWVPLHFTNSKSITACHDFILKIDWPNQYRNYDEAKFDIIQSCWSKSYSKNDLRVAYINEIRQFAALNLDCCKWINSGFWIANKKNHKNWLDKGYELYKKVVGHHIKYYEQPALNKAIEILGVQVNYLPRKYNTLVATGSKWPLNLIGLHVKIKHHKIFVEKIINEEINTTAHVRNYFIN